MKFRLNRVFYLAITLIALILIFKIYQKEKNKLALIGIKDYPGEIYMEVDRTSTDHAALIMNDSFVVFTPDLVLCDEINDTNRNNSGKILLHYNPPFMVYKEKGISPVVLIKGTDTSKFCWAHP